MIICRSTCITSQSLPLVLPSCFSCGGAENGSGDGLPEAPEGFGYLINSENAYITNDDGDYILGKI